MPRAPRDSNELGTEIRRWRARAEISRSGLAAHLDVDDSFITLVEQGARSMSDERLAPAEAYLGCPAGTLYRAAARDRRSIRLPTGIDDRDDVVVTLALRWRTLSAAKIEAIRAILAAGV